MLHGGCAGQAAGSSQPMRSGLRHRAQKHLAALTHQVLQSSRTLPQDIRSQVQRLRKKPGRQRWHGMKTLQPTASATPCQVASASQLVARMHLASIMRNPCSLLYKAAQPIYSIFIEGFTRPSCARVCLPTIPLSCFTRQDGQHVLLFHHRHSLKLSRLQKQKDRCNNAVFVLRQIADKQFFFPG